MTKAKNNGDERQDARRTSGATRRIVVQNLPPEELPRAQGRKLVTPADGPGTSRDRDERVSVREHTPRLNQGNAPRSDRGRALAPTAQGATRHLSSSTVVNGKRRPASSDQVNVRRLLVIIGGMLAVAFVGSVALLLLMGNGNKKTVVKPSQTPVAEALATPTQSAAESSIASQSSPAETNTSSLLPTPNPPLDAIPSVLEASEIRSLSEQLAAQISQKGGYAFAPEFVELIRARTQEYNSQRAMGAARLYRREINKSFRDEGMNPLVGYALAMSRSRFDPNTTEKGIGIWQMPASVARSQGYLGAAENTARLKVPETSAQISAAYTKALLSTFDAEDFMYAIACFGMSLQEAGRVQARLINVAPDAKSRRDIMKIIRAGVLNADQVDSIARFFAAGIVGENPQKFGLDDSQPFSSLY